MCNAAPACRFSLRHLARTSTKLAKPGICRTCTIGFVERAHKCQRTTPGCTALAGQEDLTEGQALLTTRQRGVKHSKKTWRLFTAVSTHLIFKEGSSVAIQATCAAWFHNITLPAAFVVSTSQLLHEALSTAGTLLPPRTTAAGNAANALLQHKR